MTVDKKMLLGQILQTEKAEKIAEVLFENGMHCFGCPSAQMESLEEACAVHGLDCDELVSKINQAIAQFIK